MGWRHGDAVVRREVWHDRAWLGTTVFVVEHSDDLLVTYLAEGSPFGFPDGDWPTRSGRHPWHGRSSWTGHGTLMLQRPGDAHAVWHFWMGTDRTFAGWYLNLQEPFRITSIGYDTLDLELDLWVPPDGDWQFKDWDVLDQRVEESRWTREEVRDIRAHGEDLGRRLDSGERWWDTRWAAWTPEGSWTPRALPRGWDEVPSPPKEPA
jgi:hypothetical protein